MKHLAFFQAGVDDEFGRFWAGIDPVDPFELGLTGIAMAAMHGSPNASVWWVERFCANGHPIVAGMADARFGEATVEFSASLVVGVEIPDNREFVAWVGRAAVEPGAVDEQLVSGHEAGGRLSRFAAGQVEGRGEGGVGGFEVAFEEDG